MKGHAQGPEEIHSPPEVRGVAQTDPDTSTREPGRVLLTDTRPSSTGPTPRRGTTTGGRVGQTEVSGETEVSGPSGRRSSGTGTGEGSGPGQEVEGRQSSVS